MVKKAKKGTKDEVEQKAKMEVEVEEIYWSEEKAAFCQRLDNSNGNTDEKEAMMDEDREREHVMEPLLMHEKERESMDNKIKKWLSIQQLKDLQVHLVRKFACPPIFTASSVVL